MRVVLDCEFTDLADPHLLALGMVASDGQEFYGELAGDEQTLHSNSFVRDTVLPQFGLVPRQFYSKLELGRAAADWLHARAALAIEVDYDYRTDFDLLELVLVMAGRWEQLREVLQPTPVSYLLENAIVDAAMEVSWHQSFAHQGIERHHALADARALDAGYRAIHGAD